MSAHRFLRVSVLAVFASLLVAFVGCSRSNLNDYVPSDGGEPDGSGDSAIDSPDAADSLPPPDVFTCNAATCPGGCCDVAGLCQSGAALTQCGTGGEACQDCQAEGFSVCDPTQHACGTPVPVCNFTTCKGCCVGNTCFGGGDQTTCGMGGGNCQDCAANSPPEACVGGQCVQQTVCDPQTCSGCCAGNSCLPGNSSTACGTQGQQCVSCLAVGETCSPFGQCQTSPSCGPGNCFGCCEGNACLPGTIDPACGIGGQACQNCTPFGATCQAGTCISSQCGPATCPFGCCQGNTCTGGSFDTACGAGGGQCQDCQIFGEVCQNQTCTIQNTCNPTTCPSGCCQGNTCVAGTSQTACGTGGVICQDCAPFGDTCQGQTCVGMGTCSPKTCPFGCCQGNTCVPGGSTTACGGGGNQCQDCSVFGDTCQNQACVAPCNPSTCPFGCCQGNVCLPGTIDTECGFGGICQNCTIFGETCQGQTCQSACNPGNCQGCCDATQTCQPGFLDTQCGGFGGSCMNCTALTPPSTCNDALSPPACASQQMTCPAPYGGCFAPPTQPPFTQPVCSASDLANGAAACAGGANTTACFNFFNFEFSNNPACAQCLQPFDFDFVMQQGVFECIAPFVSASCNQSTACAFDCDNQSCQQCPDQTTFDQCESSVGAGQCSSFQGPANACEMGAFAGPGAFCNPAGYANFGQWLKGVGNNYCGGAAVDAGAGG